MHCKRPVFMNECFDFFIVPTPLPEFFIGSKLWDGVFEEYAAIAVFSHRCNLEDESKLARVVCAETDALWHTSNQKAQPAAGLSPKVEKVTFCLLDFWCGWNYVKWESAGRCRLLALYHAASVPWEHQAAAVLAGYFHASASCLPAAGQLQFLTRGVRLNSAFWGSRFEFF